MNLLEDEPTDAGLRPWAVRNGAPGSVPAPEPETALAFHRSLPGYRPTPLRRLPDLADELGVAEVWVKEESDRWGLPAFKVLGVSWAVNRALSARAGSAPAANLGDLQGRVGHQDLTLVTATDGNHGRAVAWMARVLGLAARVYVPRIISPQAIAAIRNEGAEVVPTDLVYDDVVRLAARSCASPDELLIQDTSWPGYEQIPGWIVDGYATLFAEVDAQLMGFPDLVVVPTGVGSLLQAALTQYRTPGLVGPPAVLAVEAATSACVTRSLAAAASISVDTSTPTILAGLNCGTVSALALPAILEGLDAAVGVSDLEAAAAMHLLADHGVASGPCGAAALAGLIAVSADPDRRGAVPLGPDAVVMLISTEGSTANSTDPLA